MSKSISLAAFLVAASIVSSSFANDARPVNDTETAPSAQTIAAPPQAPDAAPPADAAVPPAADAGAVAPADSPAAAAAEKPTADASAQPVQAADDPMVCKRVEVTGSRLRKEKVCRPRSEWRYLADSARKMMKDVDRKSAPGPGGQTLPPGG